MSDYSENFIGEGLINDDVLFVPAYSEVLPRQVDTTTLFSRNIKLNIPIGSAAMDTVTDSVRAIAMAQKGGIGVKNMPVFLKTIRMMLQLQVKHLIIADSIL